MYLEDTVRTGRLDYYLFFTEQVNDIGEIGSPFRATATSLLAGAVKDARHGVIERDDAKRGPKSNGLRSKEPSSSTFTSKPSAMKFLSSAFVSSMFADGTQSEQYDPSHLSSSGQSESDRIIKALQDIVSGKLSTEELTNPEYWLDISDELSVEPSSRRSIRVDPFMQEESAKSELKAQGYFTLENIFIDADFEKISTTIRRLRARGWPPVFALMYNETWDLLEKVWGEDPVLEPSVFLWALSPRQEAQKAGERTQGDEIGNNFGLPHRDYPYTECHFEDGGYKILNIWIPLTPATLDNGCLYVLPKEFDEDFDKPDSETHMKCATPALGGATKIRFDIQGSRPVPGPPGMLVCWEGNLIHWGSRRNAKIPRISIACTFRHPTATETHITADGTLPPLSRSLLQQRLSLADRIRFISKSLLIYKFWYPMERSMFPDFFFQSLGLRDL